MISRKSLIIINLAIVSFFLSLYLLYTFEIDHTLIGVFQELLTLPMLLANVAFIIIGAIFLFKNKKDAITVISYLLLLACAVLTIGSFFYQF